MIELVVCPVLHNIVPVTPVAVNNELPQLLATVTIGVEGITFGAAVPTPGALVTPPTV